MNLDEFKPLITQPISVTLPLINSDQDIPFLVASASEQNNKITTTVQGNGIYLFDNDTRQCSHSWSVSPGTRFSCPARYLSGIQAPVIFSDDDEDEEKVANPKSTVPSSGSVFAVIQTASDISASEQGKLVKMWNVSSISAPQDGDSVIASSAAASSRKFAHSIFQLEVLPTSNISYLLIIHDNGFVTLSPSSFIPSESITQDSVWSPAKACKETILWAKLGVVEKSGTNGTTAKLFSVAKNDQGVSVRIHLISVQDDQISISQNTQFALDCGCDNPAMFALDVSSSKFFIGSNENLCVFSYEAAKFKELLIPSLKIDIKFLNINGFTSKKNSFSPTSICQVEPSYISIISPRECADGLEDVITVFDSEFGTIQTRKVIPSTLSSSSKNPRTYNINPSISTLTGTMIVTSVVEIISQSKTSYTFKAACGVIAYHAPKISLLGALGKGSLIIPKEKENDTLLSKLCDPTQTKTISQFETLFLEWISTKVSKPPKTKKSIAQEVHLFEHSEITMILQRIFGSKEKDFFPRKALLKLVESGCLSSKLPSTDTDGKSGTLIQIFLEVEDLGLLDLSLRLLPDVSEDDLVDVLKYICDNNNITKLDSYIEQQDGMVVDQESGSVSIGQSYFINSVFSIPRNDHFMIRALKKKFGTEEIDVVFNWVESLIVQLDQNGEPMPECKSLEYWWNTSKVDGELEKLKINEKTRFEMALDVVSLLIDSHFSLLLLTPTLAERLEKIQVVIESYKDVAVCLESRLRGCMTLFNGLLIQDEKNNKERERKLTEKKNSNKPVVKRQRQRWERMAQDMNDGVGSYAVEVFNLVDYEW